MLSAKVSREASYSVCDKHRAGERVYSKAERCLLRHGDRRDRRDRRGRKRKGTQCAAGIADVERAAHRVQCKRKGRSEARCGA